jgi:phosphoglycolate phosphatase-like HAD superfamily hydrolase
MTTLNQKSSPEVFIFDLDGIIANLGVDWSAAKREIKVKTGIIVNGFLDFFEASWKTPDFEKVSRIVEKFEVEAASKCTIFPDAKPALELLYKRGLRCYLASMQSVKAIEFLEEKYGLKKYFRKSIGREDAGSKKGELELALSFEKEFPRERIVFIDDQRRHMVPCRELGILCLHFDRRTSSKDLLEQVTDLVQ